MPRKNIITILFALAWGLILSCSNPDVLSPFARTGCLACHRLEIDRPHDIGCTACHKGNEGAKTIKGAHQGLIARPSGPGHMAEVCGRCHKKEVSSAMASRHFTLTGEVGALWSAFFPEDQTPSIKDLSNIGPLGTERGIVADLLRRRCLLCHVYYEGDNYSGVRRGTGCAACHLPIKASACMNGRTDHRFKRIVKDENCLACHYGNFVGWDYYGRFEKDFEEDFRAPLVKGRHISRPYGVEWHDMTPDVHRQYGMSCASCHIKGPCEGDDPGDGDKIRTISCIECHNAGGGKGTPMDQTIIGHRKEDIGRVSCDACHALWGFYDNGRSLVLQESPIFDDWIYLAVQGSSEIEKAVLDHNSGKADRITMTDKFTGEARLGLWFQVFSERRWWPVMLGEDRNGVLRVMRPIFDISISYVNAHGDVVFDNLRPKGQPLAP
ncbi:MAG: cytochrome c3 family protein, partial [Dissulfurimicrobium sp.]